MTNFLIFFRLQTGALSGNRFLRMIFTALLPTGRRLARGMTVVAALLMMFATACGRFPNPFADKQLLAKVGEESLYLHDIESIFTSGMPAEDSLKLLETYVDQWIKKELKIQEAQKALVKSQGEIDRMVEDYRNSLLTYKLDQFYVDQRIDTLFTPAQITSYYQQNKSDFVLGKPIVKAWVVKIPAKNPQLPKIKELMQSSREESYLDFVDLCLKNNFELTELSAWSDFVNLLQLFPTDKDKSYTHLLKSGKVEEFREGDHLYLVKVRDSRLTGDYAPEESVVEMIKRLIFNQRKQDIIRNYEDSLYQAARLQNKMVVNVN